MGTSVRPHYKQLTSQNLFVYRSSSKSGRLSEIRLVIWWRALAGRHNRLPGLVQKPSKLSAPSTTGPKSWPEPVAVHGSWHVGRSRRQDTESGYRFRRPTRRRPCHPTPGHSPFVSLYDYQNKADFGSWLPSASRYRLHHATRTVIRNRHPLAGSRFIPCRILRYPSRFSNRDVFRQRSSL